MTTLLKSLLIAVLVITTFHLLHDIVSPLFAQKLHASTKEAKKSWKRDALVIHTGWEHVSRTSFAEAFTAQDMTFEIRGMFDWDTQKVPWDYANHTGDPTKATFRGYDLWHLAAYEIAIACKVDFEIILDPPDRCAEHIQKKFERAAICIKEAEHNIKLYDPAVIFITQGWVLPSSAFRLVAARHGVRVIATENTLHKSRLTYDYVSGISVHSPLPQSSFLKYAPLVEPREVQAYARQYFDNLASSKTGEHKVASTHEWVPAPNTLKILVIGQVNVDSAVLFGLRPGFRSQAEMISHVLAVAKGWGASLLVKVHPKECEAAHKVANLTVTALRRHLDVDRTFGGPGSRLQLDNAKMYDTYAAIQAADVVVTINSQTGLEAAALGKPVITTGRALYSGMGFNHDAADPKELHFFVRRELELASKGVPKKGFLRQSLAGGKVPARGELAAAADARALATEAARTFLYIFLEKFCINKTGEAIVDLYRNPIL